MQDQITQLLTKVQDLETLVKFLQTNLSDNIRTFWTILGFLVVSTGGALYFLVKTVVNSRVEEELKVIKKELEEKFQGFIAETKNTKSLSNEEFGLMIGGSQQVNPLESYTRKIGLSIEPRKVKLFISDTSNNSIISIIIRRNAPPVVLFMGKNDTKWIRSSSKDFLIPEMAYPLLGRNVVLVNAEIEDRSFKLVFKNISDTKDSSLDFMSYWEAE